MCSILILRHVHPELPLILAANRDEFFERPTAGPQLLPGAPRIFVPGLDQVRGGTWMGVTDTGFFVGLTNQRGAQNLGVAARSRGEVVLQTLRSGSVEAAEKYLDLLDPTDFLPFNLLYGDARQLRIAYARPASERLERQDVPDGIHVLPNDALNTPEIPKVARARILAAEHARRPWPELAPRLQEVLSDHDLPPDDQLPPLPPDAPFSREWARQLQALCIHTPVYGTRSSALLALSAGRVEHLLASEAPPCHAAFRDFWSLLAPR
ncbi:NRDE family protein [Hyalangium minutum]|uniref:NRDE family protein n=1 Tax=Hyalangium minutum TaxID=394096 RepID=A0A085WB25_9BACT|nr:NRDE family protein [Hyalangium minutum]KFE64888.1 hypothetical protein DB31_1906 [Hyalangium minutum]